jgi:hypothetical protein
MADVAARLGFRGLARRGVVFEARSFCVSTPVQKIAFAVATESTDSPDDWRHLRKGSWLLSLW